MTTIERALAKFGHEPFPPSVEKVMELGAVLKAGKYGSSETYLSIYRTQAERMGCPFNPSEKRAAKDAVRSCNRGLGGPVRAAPLPFNRLGELAKHFTDTPCSPPEPLGPANLVVAGSWFLTREA